MTEPRANASAAVPRLVLIAGGSMEPTLGRGTWVRILAREGPPEVGDVVLIRGGEGPIVHRVLHLSRFRGGTRVFHCGDGSRRFGLAALEDVIGRVVAREPDGLPVPCLAAAEPGVRRRLRVVRLGCLLYGAARRMAEALAG